MSEVITRREYKLSPDALDEIIALRKQLDVAVEAMTASINYQETRYKVTYKGEQITQEGSLILRDALAEIDKIGGTDASDS